MSELNTAGEIERSRRCGALSARALNLLHDAGSRRPKNLIGGINAWAHTIDPTRPQ